MITKVLEMTHFSVDWVCAQHRAKMFGVVAMSFAAGGWIVSIRDQAASIPYKDRSTTTLEVIHNEVGANPISQIKCDRKVAAAVATVLADKGSDAPIAAIPVKVCPPPLPLPPAPVRK